MLRILTIAFFLAGVAGQAAEPIDLPGCYVQNRFKFNKTDCYPQIEAAVLKAAEGSVQARLLELQKSFLEKSEYRLERKSVLVKVRKLDDELQAFDSFLELDGEKLPSLGVFYLDDGEILIKNVYHKNVVVRSGVTENHRVHVLLRASYRVFRGERDQPPKYTFHILDTKIVENVIAPRIGASSSGGGH